jgi:hypothetical protein
MPKSHAVLTRSRALRAAVVLVVLVASACSSSASSTSSGATGHAEKLMVQTARSGRWTSSGAAHTLALAGVSPVTVLFTDRPDRKASAVPTKTVVEGWAKDFGTDPPNAAVQLTGGAHDQDTAIVTLSSPVYDAHANTLTYTAKVIGGDAGASLSSFTASKHDLPVSFGAVSMFIDGTNSAIAAAVTPTTAAPVKKCTQPGTPGGKALTMSLVNTSAFPDDKVYVALTGVTLEGYQSWDANPRDLINTSVPISCLPKDGSVAGGHAYKFELGEGIGSGLLWVSLGSPITSGIPQTQPSFDTTTYRFANVEFAYPGQGDMTNVDQFSFPIDLETYKAGSPKVIESTHYDAATCGIIEALKNAVTTRTAHGAKWKQVVVRDGEGTFVRVVSPKQRARQLEKDGKTPNPFAQGWPSLKPYLDSMSGKTVAVRGLFTPGAGSSYFDETGWYSYTARFDKQTNVVMTGTIGADLESGPGGRGKRSGSTIKIAAAGTDTDKNGKVVARDGLLTGLYDQSSRYTVDTTPRNGMKNGVDEIDAPDDVYNAVYRDFVTAFTYGYWGGVYGNNNEKFWRAFAPPAAPDGGKPGFIPARSTKDPAKLLPFNIWSQTMFKFSDNYNIPYGEDYGSGAPHRPSPLLDVPKGGTWRMTVKGDGPNGCLARL